MLTRLGLVFIAFTGEVFAQELPPFRLGIRTQVVSNTIEFIPKEPLDPENQLDIRPAESNYFGIALGYRWAAGTIWFSVPASDEVQASEGTSEYRDLGFSLYFKNFGFELRYSRFRGYLVEDRTPLYRVNDLDSIGYGFSVFYSLNQDSHFNMSASFDQSEIQKESGGAWLLLISSRIASIKSASSIIPDDVKSNFGDNANLSQAEMFNLGAGVGYGYNWRPGVFFFSPFIGLGLGVQTIGWLEDDGQKGRNNSLALNLHVKFGMGINLERFFLTIDTDADRYFQSLDSMDLANLPVTVTFSIGTRF